jgi:hypothetical protein
MLSNKITEHFTVKEMVCPCCEFIPAAIWSKILDTCLLLEKIRTDVQSQLIIGSCYRCQKHNAEIKGDPSSRHMKGLAADIICRISELRFKIIASAIKHGIRKIKVYPDHIHLERSLMSDSDSWFLTGDYPK